GWFRLTLLILKEVCIRVGLSFDLQKEIEAYRRINAALQEYLYELKKIDIDQFKKETEKYNRIVAIFTAASSAKELNIALVNAYTEMNIKKPWKGDFDEHMANKNGVLEFE